MYILYNDKGICSERNLTEVNVIGNIGGYICGAVFNKSEFSYFTALSSNELSVKRYDFISRTIESKIIFFEFATIF